MKVTVLPCRRCKALTVDGRSWRRWPWLREGRRVRHGRGLCDSCWYWVRTSNRVDHYPRSTWDADELLNEWEWLRSDGVPLVQAAARIGTTPAALDRALHRALQRGDLRGRHTGCYAAKRAAA